MDSSFGSMKILRSGSESAASDTSDRTKEYTLPLAVMRLRFVREPVLAGFTYAKFWLPLTIQNSLSPHVKSRICSCLGRTMRVVKRTFAFTAITSFSLYETTLAVCGGGLWGVAVHAHSAKPRNAEIKVRVRLFMNWSLRVVRGRERS